MSLERDLVGYGANPPNKPFANGARLAVSLVVNYEEGSERSHAMGDPDQEEMTEFGSYPFPPRDPQPGDGVHDGVRLPGGHLARA